MGARLRWQAVLVAASLVVAVGAAAASVSRSASPLGASGVCSQATAERLVALYRLNTFLLPKAADQPICGPFTGAGSDAMAVAIRAATCWPLQSWAVFTRTGNNWKLVLSQPAYLVPPLVAVGADIRETTAVHRPGDSRCVPSGGTHARLWHWNGRRLIAGAWKQAKVPAASSAAVHLFNFQSPSHNILCDQGDEDRVVCKSYNLPHYATLTVDGRIKICNGGKCVSGRPGAASNAVPVLAYGQEDDQSSFLCRSESKGVTCTVDQPGKSHGKGFLINAAGVKNVGP